MDSVLDQIAAADKQIAAAEAVKANAREKVVEEVKKMVACFSVTADELFNKGSGAKKGVRAPVPPKYRNKATGKLWAGRGRCPKGFEKDDLGAFVEDVEIL